jgi:nitric oxide reductase activation protein
MRLLVGPRPLTKDVLTFSGKGAENVRLRTIKGFGERTGEEVRRRITALRPEGYTRLGPAVRRDADVRQQSTAI